MGKISCDRPPIFCIKTTFIALRLKSLILQKCKWKLQFYCKTCTITRNWKVLVELIAIAYLGTY